MGAPIAWIDVADDAELDGAVYRGLKRPDGTVHNLYRAFSLWPAPLSAADALYRAILHSPDGPLTFAECELLATQVAVLTGCAYAQAHHGENFKRLQGERGRAETMIDHLRLERYPDDLFGPRLKAMLAYGAKLTRAPEALGPDDVAGLRDAGLSDPEILHLNQVSANFNYWVRVINGLGIALGGEEVGMAPDALDEIDTARRNGP
ncbi:MAG: peroxidase-related enzyme [Hyphomicrobiales bacterium]